MASLFKDRSLGQSKRDTMTSATSLQFTSAAIVAITNFSLLFPVNDLTSMLSAIDLHNTAYEIFVAAYQTSSEKSLTYIPSNSSNVDLSLFLSLLSLSSLPFIQRLLTSTAASKVKKVHLDLRNRDLSGDDLFDGRLSNNGDVAIGDGLLEGLEEYIGLESLQ